METTTFQGLYDAHARDVYRFARFLTGSDDAAEDIVGETFLRAWAGRDAIRHVTARAYLIAIARNLARDRRRRARRWPAAELPDRPVAPDAEARLELGRAWLAVEELPEPYREALLLVAQGLSYEEAGRVLELPLSTVKIRVHRARQKLAAALAPPKESTR